MPCCFSNMQTRQTDTKEKLPLKRDNIHFENVSLQWADYCSSLWPNVQQHSQCCDKNKKRPEAMHRQTEPLKKKKNYLKNPLTSHDHVSKKHNKTKAAATSSPRTVVFSSVSSHVQTQKNQNIVLFQNCIHIFMLQGMKIIITALPVVTLKIASIYIAPNVHKRTSPNMTPS